MSIYGGGLPAPTISLAACAALLNNTTSMNNTTSLIIQNTTQAIHLAVTDPTLFHVAGVMPLVAGGFMITNTGVRMIRLWIMEVIDYWRR